jgi:UDP-N-acetyl-D-mannosaminuronic acid transferase (WecB/TagA/CpsF family)
MLLQILPKITKTKSELLDKIANLPKGSRSSLYLLYSEFFLRSKVNSNYWEILLESSFLAVDGKGVLWGLDKLQSEFIDLAKQTQVKITSPVSKLYKTVQNSKSWLFWESVFALSSKQNLSKNTGIDLVLGRDFVYDLLYIANQKSWKVGIIGAGNLELVTTKLKNLYTNSAFCFYNYDCDSITMNDKFEFGTLDDQNLLVKMPDLQFSKDFVKLEGPDLLLVCLGGISGKQEFLIHHLQNSKDLNFGLAVGIGAGLDHLGSGKKQQVVPSFVSQFGLEALWRLAVLPQRRKRVLDSVFGFAGLVGDELKKL